MQTSFPLPSSGSYSLKARLWNGYQNLYSSPSTVYFSTAFSTTTMGYDFFYNLNATSTDYSAYSLSSCNALTCSALDLSGCFKSTVCWAFVPPVGVITQASSVIGGFQDLTFLTSANVFFSSLQSAFSTITATPADIKVHIGGVYNQDVTVIHFADLQSKTASFETLITPWLRLVMGLFLVFYIINAFRRAVGEQTVTTNFDIDTVNINSDGGYRAQWLKQHAKSIAGRSTRDFIRQLKP